MGMPTYALFGRLPGLRVSDVAEDLTTRTALAMELLDGVPMESVADQPGATPHRVATRLVEHAPREPFGWGVDAFRDTWWMNLAEPTASSLATNQESFPKSLPEPSYPVGLIAGIEEGGIGK